MIMYLLCDPFVIKIGLEVEVAHGKEPILVLL